MMKSDEDGKDLKYSSQILLSVRCEKYRN